MAENNSLSDLSNDGLGFNSYLDPKTISSNNKSTNKFNAKNSLTQKKIEQKQEQLKVAKSQEERNQLQTDIDQLQAKANSSNTTADPTIETKLGNNSLFDRYAVIDYARYVRSTPWDEYKKDNDTFVVNSDVTSINSPVPPDSDIGDDGLSVKHLIAWSEKYPALQLRYQDFAFCRRIGYYPNNRLIVLRRFKNGVPDNLFDYHVKNSNENSNAFLYSQPISTLVTWLKPDESAITVSFNENWVRYEKGIKDTLTTEVNKDSKTENASKNSFSNFNNLDSSIITALLQTAGDKNLARKDGVDYIGRSIEGNPNLIVGAIKRTTGPDNANLYSNISFPSLKFEYEMRYINGVDPGIALLDLISNCLRMGTSVSEFKYPIPFLTDNEDITNLINGDFEVNFKEFSKNIEVFFKNISSTFKNFINNVEKSVNEFATDPSGGFSSLTSDVLKQLISRYRETLKAALAADTGLPTGIWHVTIGNPKNPIVSCGDLFVKSSKVELGKELGYNDFPTTFSCEFTLESAKPRGRNDIERIFNSGRGRVYIYSDWRSNPDYDQYTTTDNKSKN